MMKFMKKMNGVLNASESTARLSFIKEQAIKTVFFLTAFFAVIVVLFILLFLVRDGYVLFEKVGCLLYTSDAADE